MDFTLTSDEPKVIRAYAKINLSLEVLGRRPDGYHSLVSVMQEISLADEILICPAAGVDVVADDPLVGTSDNLAGAAARLLMRASREVRGARISLHKHIPVAAGLAGGSADAAATLVSLNRISRAGLPVRRLLTLAARLGSDVPFFLYGGTCLVLGRGEHVVPLPAPAPVWYALSNPGIPVSTARVFMELPRCEWSNGRATESIADDVRQGKVRLGPNDLQTTLFRLYPAARHCFDRQVALAPGRTSVTGSGPTVYSACSSMHEAHDIAAQMRDAGYWADVARSVNPRPGENPCRSGS